jgi:hypothetical protein
VSIPLTCEQLCCSSEPFKPNSRSLGLTSVFQPCLDGLGLVLAWCVSFPLHHDKTRDRKLACKTYLILCALVRPLELRKRVPSHLVANVPFTTGDAGVTPFVNIESYSSAYGKGFTRQQVLMVMYVPNEKKRPPMTLGYSLSIYTRQIRKVLTTLSALTKHTIWFGHLVHFVVQKLIRTLPGIRF